MKIVVVVALLLPLAGCLGGQDNPEPNGGEPEPETPVRNPWPVTQFDPDAQLAQTGRWLAPFDGEIPAISMALLHTNEIVYWNGVEANNTDGAGDAIYFTSSPADSESRILDLTGSTPIVTLPVMAFDGWDLFCSGQTILPDGRLLTAGGSSWVTLPDDQVHGVRGMVDALIFDPITREWSSAGDMNLARWYPTLYTGADGNAVALGGIETLSEFTTHWANGEFYSPEGDEWFELPGAEQLLPLYPRVRTVPSGPMEGQVFFDTTGALWAPYGEHPQQYEWSFMGAYDPGADTWHTHDESSFGARSYASSVLLPLDPAEDYHAQIISSGGTLQQFVAATPLVERIDLAGATPTATQVSNLPAGPSAPEVPEGRWMHHSVIGASGDMFVLGGVDYDNVVAYGGPTNPRNTALHYDPAADAWQPLAEATVDRGYHSTAILLPDATILTGGHVPLPQITDVTRAATPPITETRFEIFQPPYLFRGERPVIADADEQITYGSEFEILLEGNATIESIMLVHPGSATHGFDSGQRNVFLEFETEGDRIAAVAPPNANISVPGWHMVFVNGQTPDGPIPSVATWVQLS